MTRWYVWLAVFPAVYWLSRRYPFEPPGVLRSVAVHGAALLSITVTILAMQAEARIVAGWAPGDVDFPRSFALVVRTRLLRSTLTYLVLLGTSQALLYYFRNQARQVRELELEAQLARTQMEALKSQIQPHFLFNALNHVTELIHENPARAEAMIVGISELLRAALGAPAAAEVPLREELAFVDRYLAIQKIRFGDRLKIERDIDPAVLEHAVPALILQPVIENSIQHGIGTRPGVGRIAIEARRLGQANALELRIRDNGNGMGGGQRASTGNGIGLTNVRQRLEKHYPGDHTLECQDLAGQGFEVYMRIPGGPRA